MTHRPRGHQEEESSTSVRGEATRAPSAVTAMVHGEQKIAEKLERGRSATEQADSGTSPSSSVHTADDVALQAIMRRYEQLGDEPPRFNISANDDAYHTEGAHTIDRHGPQLPLPRRPGLKTIEGRVYGDTGWGKAESASYRWTDLSTLNREVNRYVRENWQTIRDDLALDEFHQQTFNAGHRVGLGYYNKGMYGAGPRQAEYGETSLVRVRIRVVEGSDPAVPFIVSAFPAGLG